MQFITDNNRLDAQSSPPAIWSIRQPNVKTCKISV